MKFLDVYIIVAETSELKGAIVTMKSIGNENGDEHDNELFHEQFDELVLYGIDKLSHQELLLFRAACQRVDIAREGVALFNFEEVQHFFNVKNIEDYDAVEELCKMCGKLLNPTFKYSKHSEHFVLFRIFQSVHTDGTERTVRIRASEKFVNMLIAFEQESGEGKGPRIFLGTTLPRGKRGKSEYSFGLDVLIGQTKNPRLF